MNKLISGFLLSACGGASVTASTETTTITPSATQASPSDDVASYSAPPPQASATSAAPTASAGMHFSVGNIEADGVTLSNLACENVSGGIPGGIFGAITLAAGFKERKAQLDACAPKSTDTRVEWVGASGQMTNVKAHGISANADRCVERALTGAMSTITGTCTATVKHGH